MHVRQEKESALCIVRKKKEISCWLCQKKKYLVFYEKNVCSFFAYKRRKHCAWKKGSPPKNVEHQRWSVQVYDKYEYIACSARKKEVPWLWNKKSGI